LQGLCRSSRQYVRVEISAGIVGRRARLSAVLAHLEDFPCKKTNLVAHLNPESIVGGPHCAGT